MFERVFLHVEGKQASAAAADLALSLAQPLGSRVFATYVIDTAILPRGANRQEKLSDIEEQAWQTLYEIEDDAFEREIRISLLLDQGNPLERLLDLARSYQAQLLVTAARSRLSLPDLVKRSPVPVLIASGQTRGAGEADERAV